MASPENNDQTDNTNYLGNVGSINARPSRKNPGAAETPTNTIRYPEPMSPNEVVDSPYADTDAPMGRRRAFERTAPATTFQEYQDSQERQAQLVQQFYANRPVGPMNYDETRRGAAYSPDSFSSFPEFIQGLKDGRSVVTNDGEYWANAPDLMTDKERTLVGTLNSGNTFGIVFKDSVANKDAARINSDMIARHGSMDAEEYAASLAELNPAILAKAAVSGLAPSEMGSVARILAAKNVAEVAFTRVAASKGSQQGFLAARQIIASVEDEGDQGVVAMFFQDILNSGSEADDNGENWTSQGIAMLGTLAAPVFNFLMLGNDTMVQFATAMANRQMEAFSDFGNGDFAGGIGNTLLGLSPAAPLSTLVDGSYGEADKGTLNQAEMSDLRNEYGDFAVDVLADVYEGYARGDDDLLEKTFAKYENNPEAWSLIQQGMMDASIGGNTSYSDLYTKIAFADQGNPGNALVRAMPFIDPTSAWATGIRDVTNTTAMLTLDPLNAAFGAGVALKGAKYGFWLLGKTVNVEKAFTRAKVQNWYNWFGKELQTLKALDDAGDTVAYGRKYTTLVSQSKKYANDETIRLFTKHGIFDADSARDFYMSMESVEKIAAGKASKMRPKPEGYGARGKKGTGNREGRGKRSQRSGQVPSTAEDAIAAAASQAQAQVAKRTNRVYVPHQSAATTVLKQTIGQVRGAADITKYLARSTPVLDDVLGSDWVTLTSSERSTRLASVMADDALVDRLAREVGDWSVDAAGAPKRTVAGQALDSVLSGNGERATKWRNALGVSRSGWAKKGVLRGDDASLALSRAADRFAAVWARMPDTRGGIVTLDARDAGKIYQMMRLAGVNRPMASMFRAEWAKMNQAQRELAFAGMVRTYGRASGLDRVLLDSTGATKFDELLKGVSGTRMNERYAADQYDRFGGAMRDADAQGQLILDAAISEHPVYQDLVAARLELDRLNSANAPLLARAAQERAVEKAQDAWKPVAKGLRADMKRQVKIAKQSWMDEANLSNPGEVNVGGSTRQGAVWLSQTNDALAMPNFGALDNFAARRSYMNALLVNNRVGQTVTDLWTFGTLAGPRFQLRNGLEDMVLYVITGGKMGAFSEGRRISTIVRSATARFDQDVQKAKGELEAATKKADDVRKRATDQSVIDAAENVEARAAERLAKLERAGLKPRKLGIVNTARMTLAVKLSNNAGLAGRENTLRARLAAAIFMPMTSPAERAAAAKLGRDGVVALQMKALARQRLLLVKDPEARGIAVRLRRGAEIEDLSPRQQEILRDMDDLLKSTTGEAYEQKAAETSRHLADSLMPADGDLQPLVKVGGKWYRRVRVDQTAQYVSERTVVGRVTPPQAEGAVRALHNVTSDGPRGQAILQRLERWWAAENRRGSSDAANMRKIEDEVLNYIKSHEMWPVYRERFRLYEPADERLFVQKGFKDASGTFTTPEGKFNKELLDALWNPEKKGYSVIDEATGDPVVAMEDFLSGTFKPPYHTVAVSGESFLVPADMGSVNALIDKGWSAMGRSLARMTREPIFKANYLESRKTFRALEEVYAKQFGEDAARSWASKQSSERAYALTMSYVDNPAVRSRAAYRVRNVARFYRAIEDFGRRMYRVAKNDPIAFWRASLIWEATNESGFSHTDEYGQDYFVYPGSAAGLEFLSRWLPMFGSTAGFMIGGKVQWLSPSADPDSWMPTLASPWASIVYRPVLRAIGGPDDIFGDIDRQLFGAIGADKDLNLDGPLDGILGEVIEGLPGALPPIIDKAFLGLLPAALGIELPGTLSYNATMKAAMMMQAQGRGLSMADSKDPVKAEAYANELRSTSLAVVFGMIVTGLFAPSAPQLMEDTVSKLGRDLSSTGMRPSFLKGMKQAMESEDGIDGYWKWIEKWTSENPGLGIYSLSRSEAAEMGYMEPLEGNAEFAIRHSDLMTEYPIGVSIFGPNTGEVTTKSMRVLNMFDVRTPKTLIDQVKDLATQEARIDYQLGRRYMQADVDAAPTEEQRKIRQSSMDATLASWRTRADMNGLSTRLYVNEREQPEYWADRVEEIRTVAEAIGTDGNGLGPEVLRAYEGYAWAKSELDQLVINQSANPNYDAERATLKEAWDGALTTELQRFPGNDQWERILEIMTSALSQGWQLPGK